MEPSVHIDTFCRDNLPARDDWPELIELPYPGRLNCAEALLDTTIGRYGGNRRCLLSPTETWSYDDLRRRADGVARVLVEDLGLVPGNRVLLRGPNNPWLVACWFGVLKAGGVAGATMSLLCSAELAVIRDMARVDLALCDHRFTEALASIPGLRVVPYGSDAPDDLVRRAAEKPAG